MSKRISQTRMKVAFFTNIIPPYRKTFYERLCSLEEFHWIVVRGRTSQDAARHEYAGSIIIPETRVQNKERQLGPFTLRWQSGAIAVARRTNPDIIVILGMVGNVSNWLLLFWAKLKGRPIVIWACGWEPQRQRPVALWIKQRIARIFYGMATACLVYSTKAATYLESLGVSKTKLTVCYNGIEIDDLIAREAQTRSSAVALRSALSPHARVVFLFVGAMLQEKRVDLLLQAYKAALKDRPDVALWLVGDGPSKETSEQMARALGLTSVHFLGRIVEDVDKYFAAADFFVLPGLGGLAFNQAMFWGTPCIGGEADGTEDDLVIDYQTGRRFAPGDATSLGRVMDECINMTRDERQKLQRESRRLILERSNVGRMVDTFRTVLCTVSQRHEPYRQDEKQR
jgi:glycosyltransferase involved in cell wall biosynthesis